MCLLETCTVACELRLSRRGGRPPAQFTAAAVALFLMGQRAQRKLQGVEPTGPPPAVTALFVFLTPGALARACFSSPQDVLSASFVSWTVEGTAQVGSSSSCHQVARLLLPGRSSLFPVNVCNVNIVQQHSC